MAMRETLDRLDRDELARRLDEALDDQESSRTILTVGGGALTLFGLTRMTPFGVLLALVGGGLIYLGQQGRSLKEYGRSVGHMAESMGTVDVEKTVTVNLPHDQVYAYWRNFENLKRFMKHIDDVQVLGDRRSRWKGNLLRGMPAVEWEAETIEDTPNERISWRSLPGGDIETNGVVRFHPIMGGRATEVRLTMEYRVPGGRPIAALLNPGIASIAKEDLRRFKQLLESGETGAGRSASYDATPQSEVGDSKPIGSRSRFEFE